MNLVAACIRLLNEPDTSGPTGAEECVRDLLRRAGKAARERHINGIADNGVACLICNFPQAFQVPANGRCELAEDVHETSKLRMIVQTGAAHVFSPTAVQKR